jgi:hypothetical protein
MLYCGERRHTLVHEGQEPLLQLVGAELSLTIGLYVLFQESVPSLMMPRRLHSMKYDWAVLSGDNMCASLLHSWYVSSTVNLQYSSVTCTG